MPAKFSRMGISFQYPDNWTLDEEDALAGRQSVTVYSPGGAFWSVALHPPSADPEKMARAAVDVMRQEYGEVEVDAARETLAGHELIGFDLGFYFLDLINSARVRSVQIDRTTYTVFCQAEDREFEKLSLVFQAITVSLLGGVNTPGSGQ